MRLFRAIQPYLFEAVSRRCVSSLPSASSSSILSQSLYQRNQFVLPEAAQQRYQHTGSYFSPNELSLFQHMKWSLGFYGKLKFNKHELQYSGMKLYVCSTDLVDFKGFIKETNLPDTFDSWFLLLHLHLWLISVRLVQLGKEGFLTRQAMYKYMWQDVAKRLRSLKLGIKARNETNSHLYSLMIFSTTYYDEGLIGDDKMLANALWTCLYSMDANIKPQSLELMVEYVRKQVQYLDDFEEFLILGNGYVNFLPVHGTTPLDEDTINFHLNYLDKRVDIDGNPHD